MKFTFTIGIEWPFAGCSDIVETITVEADSEEEAEIIALEELETLLYNEVSTYVELVS